MVVAVHSVQGKNSLQVWSANLRETIRVSPVPKRLNICTFRQNTTKEPELRESYNSNRLLSTMNNARLNRRKQWQKTHQYFFVVTNQWYGLRSGDYHYNSSSCTQRTVGCCHKNISFSTIPYTTSCGFHGRSHKNAINPREDIVMHVA